MEGRAVLLGIRRGAGTIWWKNPLRAGPTRRLRRGMNRFVLAYLACKLLM
jgi:hypothetical protein